MREVPLSVGLGPSPAPIQVSILNFWAPCRGMPMEPHRPGQSAAKRVQAVRIAMAVEPSRINTSAAASAVKESCVFGCDDMG